MVALLERRVAKPGPKADPDGRRPTKLVRVNKDLAVMLGWLAKLEGVKAAEFTDPLLRPAVVARYTKIATEVEAIKARKARRLNPPAE